MVGFSEVHRGDPFWNQWTLLAMLWSCFKKNGEARTILCLMNGKVIS